MLNKDILVAILEDDLFSRNWMALLLVRDWRTRVIGEFTSRAELFSYLNRSPHAFDVLILDVDLFVERFSIDEICKALTKLDHVPKILLTGIKPDLKIIKQIENGNENIRGYVLKSEVGYSLSWVITFVDEGYWVMTPSIRDLFSNLLPDTLTLEGRQALPGFTDHEAEVARMAFIFSLGRRDLADELKISEQWGYSLVSELYKKLGLPEIISGEVDLFSYIGESTIIRKKFHEIVEQMGTSKKARDMETLAYHLLTMPEIIS